MYAKLLWWSQEKFYTMNVNRTFNAFSIKMHAQIQGYILYTYQLFKPSTEFWVHTAYTFNLGALILPFMCIVSVVHFPMYEKRKKKLVAIYVYGFTMHILCLILVHWVCNKTKAIEKKKENNNQMQDPKSWMGVKSKVCHYAL